MAFIRKNFHVVAFLGILLCVLTVVGCSSLGNSFDAYNASKVDSSSFAQMQAVGSMVHNVVGGAASASPLPVPLGELLATSAGLIASFITGVFLGKKKKKESEV